MKKIICTAIILAVMIVSAWVIKVSSQTAGSNKVTVKTEVKTAVKSDKTAADKKNEVKTDIGILGK